MTRLPKLPDAIVAAAALVLALSGCRTPGALSGAQSGAQLREAGSSALQVCTGGRKFFDPAGKGFDFAARQLSLPNAYWLAALSSHAYVTKDVVLTELGRLGFKDSPDAAAPDHLFFLDEDGIRRNFLRTGLNYRWASTQAFWAESAEGAVLSFRGSVPSEIGDIMSDIYLSQADLNRGGVESLGVTAVDPYSGEAVGQGADQVQINVHKGFYYALDIVWPSIEKRAKELYAQERPIEKAAKQKRLDELGDKLVAGDVQGAAVGLKALAEWQIPLPGKQNFLKTWVGYKNDPAKRDQLFEFLDQNWGSWQKPIWLTGHSLGGALATIAAYRLLKMGMNVHGLYTFGSPRVGNYGFVHDFRVLAFQRGLKGQGNEGNLQRFMNHNDIVARVPPALGFTSLFNSSSMNGMLDKWKHVSRTRYLTGDGEADDQELWLEGSSEFQDRMDKVPQYTVKLPVEAWRNWAGDHMIPQYLRKIEALAFGENATCP